MRASFKAIYFIEKTYFISLFTLPFFYVIPICYTYMFFHGYVYTNCIQAQPFDSLLKLRRFILHLEHYCEGKLVICESLPHIRSPLCFDLLRIICCKTIVLQCTRALFSLVNWTRNFCNKRHESENLIIIIKYLVLSTLLYCLKARI